MNTWKPFILQLLLITAVSGHIEPNCEFPCTANADCVGQNECRYRNGYTDVISQETGTPYCQPICQSDCPHGRCIAPEECDCIAGYQPTNGSCEPATMTTTSITVRGKTVSAIYESKGETITTTTTEGEYVSQLYLVSGEPDTNCPPTFLNINGTCRPEVYDECDLKQCGPNAQCNDHGKCVCLPGYSWQHLSSDPEVTSKQCLTLISANRTGRRHEYFYTALGSGCILIAFIVFVVILLKNF